MAPVDPKLEAGWKAQLLPAFQTQGFAGLKQFLQEERAAGQTVYPPASRIFAAMDETPWDQVRVVLLGQDPYHGPGQANGLCFSVADGIPLPPSLKNMYKEMATDLEVPAPSKGDLSPWAKQGVLLLNATLTVRAHQAGSHQKRGWEEFTDEIVARLNEHPRRLVFILWGSYAKRKAQGIDRTRHRFISAPHPSPLSAHRGFFGSRPYSQCNEILESWGEAPIDWVSGLS